MNNHCLTVRYIRGSLVESIHCGHAVITSSSGQIIVRIGNPEYVTFARSTAKPLQAIAMVESGAIERYKLTHAEIAVICSSHNGEERHVQAVLSILQKLGVTASSLRCSAHEPYYKPAEKALLVRGMPPTNLHNNCSGKHTGMIALSRMLDADPANYDNPQHPVQLLILKIMAAFCDVDPEQIIIAIDGCGVPVFGITLHQLATSYAKLGTPPSSFNEARTNACLTIIEAVRKQPFYLAGSDRFDTDLIQATKGKIIGKMGAEGIYAFTVPHQDIGGVIKIVDGAKRAIYPAVVEVLYHHKLLDEHELQNLKHYYKPELKGPNGQTIGSIVPSIERC